MRSRHLIASLVASSCFLCGPAVAQRIRIEPSELLGKDELKAFEELKAAGGNPLSTVLATADKEAGLVSLHFNRELTANDAPLLRRIHKLDLLFFATGPSISDERLPLLEGVGMQGLAIWNQPVTDEGLKALRLFPQLTQLSLSATQVTDAGLNFCRDTRLPLRTLAIQKSAITDAGLRTIGQLKSLEILNLYGCNKITDDGIGHLSSLVNLKRLFLNNNDLLTSSCLKHLTQLKKLTRLEIDGIALAEDLRPLQGFNELETLSMTRTNLSDEDIAIIAALKSLKNLNLQQTKITDRSAAVLGTLKKLTSLELGKTEITDDGLARLADLKDLQSLDVSNTKITDASVDTISGFKGLAHLNLEGSAISADGKKRIQAQLPKCTIVQPKRARRPPRPPKAPPAPAPRRDRVQDIRDRLTGSPTHASRSRTLRS